LNRRIASAEEVAREAAAWEAERNAKHKCLHWTFTISAARVKMKEVYPNLKTPKEVSLASVNR
jgi:hypothetical protein